jgi:hypothetical protein
MAKGRKTGGRDFSTGVDPRRVNNGRPTVDVKISEMKAEMRQFLIEAMKEYSHLPKEEVAALTKDPKMPLAKLTALRFWIEVSNNGDPSRMAFLSKILGLEEAQKHDVQVSSLESLIVASKKEDEEE